MGSAMRRMLKVLDRSDVVLEVVDARFPKRSKKVRDKVVGAGKRLILVVNKVDLVGRKEGERIAREMRGLAFSAKTRYGKRKLVRRLERLAGGEEIRVGIVGRPNVGKSQLINALKGRKTAKTSSTPGYTRGEQWFRISPRILIVDSPGVISGDMGDDELVIQNALDVDKADDPVMVALKLFKIHPRVLKSLGIEGRGEEALEEYARRTGKLKKGGEPHMKEAARMIVRLWQKGKLK